MAVKKGKLGELLVPEERIAQGILIIRGHKVMLVADLADLYGVTTKRLNEQVKRNQERFPADFMFQLTEEEKARTGGRNLRPPQTPQVFARATQRLH